MVKRGASLRTIERQFSDETGLTLGRWRRQLRMVEALRLLAAGEPVTSVALEVGYPDASHFSHSIRQVYGLTPKDIFAGSRRFAEEWAYRFLGAAVADHVEST